ncbi:UvrD-helicase domain-containing protein [Clostridium saccharoperbutylacetonicum]|uniref:UvrD-helicase domain-containing protein n=1 Tax=Clostridium saccharoperbutylacetonicum TaxID=36745 RepID=UPI000983D61E|nr:UvrD-helicase domain-containing protein [Clostridium saccharoperbutylacetonicum]AQR93104.1 helicase IV [Clostridium saccharoperbutylacetonicum]NSB34514.1 DNA helicase-4 [Clostridium saccharoperbutylacetonicum]
MTLITFIIIMALLVISFLGYKRIKEEQLKKEPLTVSMTENVLNFFQELEQLKKDYITNPQKDKLIEKYESVYEFFNKKPYSKFKIEQLTEFKDIFKDINTFIKKCNEEYIEKELNINKELFDNIDGRSLDEQQRRAVLVDEINNLVLAGAGSGKTLTISGKVKYLVDTKNINPEEILLISFTKKAAEEMYTRISEKLHINVEAKTFHKLGLDIIKKSSETRFDIAEDNLLKNVIDNYFNNNLYKNIEHVTNLINFFGYYLNIPKDWAEFKSLGDCLDYYKNIDFETLKSKCTQYNAKDYVEELKLNKQTIQGETVKSLEEVMIANYLFLNGINYIYEYKYPFESPDKYRKQYRPDFYLSDYDIYLEHFGITSDNRVPWLSKIEEQKYLEGIDWKRGFHNQNGTKLLETYSYYNKEGRLLTELEKILRKNNVQFKQVDYIQIYKQVFDNTSNKYFSEFKKLISSFIGLYKSNDYSLEYFDQLKEIALNMNNSFLRERTKIFIDIIKPIYIKYQETLRNSNTIDFNDMINLASEIVTSNKIKLNYKYIIIDEYQDISISRFKLIKEIINQTGAKLMCVGDDWQSIYRFTGADIDLFTNFEKYMGYYELLKIEKTYRNSQELINVAAKFVMRNNHQLKKNLKSDKHNSNPIRILGYDKDICTAVENAIGEIVYNFGEEAEISILGRNNFDIDTLINSSGNKFIKTKGKGQVLVKYSKYHKLKLNYLTAHKSKGLEADNVIIINLENKLLGFPSKISDDPILSLVLTDIDGFDFAEERRVFYVALTRTKNSTFLIVPDKNKSVFVEELIKHFNITYEFTTKEQTITDNPNCPRCQKGHLVLRDNKSDSTKFLGCSNYPACDYTLKNIEIINEQIKCNCCGGYMTKRKGPYGRFYACTNYPYCHNTFKIQQY